MSKFKVGDEVIITGTSQVCTRGCGERECEYIRKKGIITYIDSSQGKVSVKEFKGTTGWCSGFDINFIKLVIKQIEVFGIVNFCNDIKKGKYGR